jgi:tyrosine-protein phosphatase SIW14
MNTVEADARSSFDLEMAGVVVSKRSTRGTVEYGKEGESKEHQSMAKKPSKPSNISHEETQDSRVAGLRGRSSSVSYEGCEQFGDALFRDVAKAEYRASFTTTTRPSTQPDALEIQGRSSRMSPDDAFGDVERATGNSSRKAPNSQEAKSHLVTLPTEGQPTNFGTVVPGVYRSSYPQSEDYPFLEKLGLRTVV